MEAVYDNLLPGLWCLWGLYWGLSSLRVKQVQRIESIRSRLGHVLPLLVAAYLLAVPKTPFAWLNRHFMPTGQWSYVAGTVITVLGLAFAVWARVHIGRNWSGMVTVKADHELVRSGPYRWVRHPIYTGILLGFVGSALARAQWSGVAAVVIVFAAFWRKLKLEEHFMTETFGDRYREYREQVSALIPLLL